MNYLHLELIYLFPEFVHFNHDHSQIRPLPTSPILSHKYNTNKNFSRSGTFNTTAWEYFYLLKKYLTQIPRLRPLPTHSEAQKRALLTGNEIFKFGSWFRLWLLNLVDIISIYLEKKTWKTFLKSTELITSNDNLNSRRVTTQRKTPSVVYTLFVYINSRFYPREVGRDEGYPLLPRSWHGRYLFCFINARRPRRSLFMILRYLYAFTRRIFGSVNRTQSMLCALNNITWTWILLHGSYV